MNTSASDTAFSWPDGRHVALSLSFDDGRSSQIAAALPVLQEFSAKAAFYLTPEAAEKNTAAWREAASLGHEIGNHSVTHPCSLNFRFAGEHGLENMSLDDMERELLDCNHKLQDLLGVAAETFAYPCGQTFVGRGENTQSYVPLVARHFLAGRTYMSEWYNDPAACDLAQLYGRGFDELPFDIIHDWLEKTRQRNGWLVLAGHDAGDENKHQMVRTDTLKALCKYAQNPDNSIWLCTVAEGARYLRNRRGF
jgi:peptidoglycan/xylan/chitin deacetylase (PgdA/CDA1 family)